MSPEHFLELARLLPEPTLLISGLGQILATNPPVTTLLGLRGQELRDRALSDLVIDAPDRVSQYLHACLKTREMVPGSFTFRAKDQREILCRCEGAVIQPGSPASAAQLLVRVHRQERVVNRFLLLNKQIDQLTKQLRVRWRLEEALRRANMELEQRVQERTLDLVQANNALQAEMREREQAEQKLLESERLAGIGTAAAKIAHEIGNPLNGMYTTVQLLERYITQHKDQVDPGLVSTTQDLTREINRLRALLQELRSFSRSQQLTVQRTDLAAMVAEVLAIETPYYTKRGVQVVQDFPRAFPLTLADREKLKQVFFNLCKNAVEAMPQGGTLTVRGCSAGGQVALEIQDTGIGVPEEVDIFEPFTTTKPEGTGLGLAVARQIILAHGGTLTYTSVPGKGTTFTLTLPVHCQRA